LAIAAHLLVLIDHTSYAFPLSQAIVGQDIYNLIALPYVCSPKAYQLCAMPLKHLRWGSLKTFQELGHLTRQYVIGTVLIYQGSPPLDLFIMLGKYYTRCSRRARLYTWCEPKQKVANKFDVISKFEQGLAVCYYD